MRRVCTKTELKGASTTHSFLPQKDMEDSTCLVITRLSDGYERRIPMKDRGILRISRAFVQEGRNAHAMDKFVTRGTHVLLVRMGHRIQAFNQHENEVVVYGPPVTTVEKNRWARVDSRILNFCVEPGYTSVHDLEFHIDLDNVARESPPPTPPVVRAH